MGITRKLIELGNGADKPKKGDEVTIKYTGSLYDSSIGPENDFRGKPYVYNIIQWPYTVKREL